MGGALHAKAVRAFLASFARDREHRAFMEGNCATVELHRDGVVAGGGAALVRLPGLEPLWLVHTSAPAAGALTELRIGLRRTRFAGAADGDDSLSSGDDELDRVVATDGEVA